MSLSDEARIAANNANRCKIVHCYNSVITDIQRESALGLFCITIEKFKEAFIADPVVQMLEEEGFKVDKSSREDFITISW